MYAPFEPVGLFLQTATQLAPNAHEIVPGLWLGNRAAAEDGVFLERNNIAAIINATKDLPFARAGQNFRVAVDDNLQPSEVEQMAVLLPHAASFLYKCHYIDKQPVLVHCFAGVQRSATIVAYYLYAYFKYPIEQAIKLVISKRPIAFNSGKNINFQRALGL